MAGCESCNSCNGVCNNSCNSCNSCNASCEGTCQDSKQKASQGIGYPFKFRNKNLDTNHSFLTTQEWNSLLDYISNGYGLKGNPLSSAKGSVYNYNGQSIKAGAEYGNEFMSANMYNGAIAKMRYATSGNGSPGSYEKTGGPNGDIIYASYFTALEEYASGDSFKVNYCNSCDSCNSCVTTCEGGCNSCNSCNSCQGKDSCCYTPPPASGGGGS